MAAHQDDDRHIEPALADERYQRRGPTLQALAAPVDDDAADRGIRADDKFCIVIPPSTDRRVTQPLDLVQDVAQSRALEIGLVEVASAYQELEVACIFHFRSPMGTVHEPYDSRATMPVSPTRSIGAGRLTKSGPSAFSRKCQT